ncbi:MAG TPA: colicin immunity domain-containing protein, partial [Rhizomicrobium sp.]|nr:colicin immunity domain-containing protein [Rhizomicrobium sp.]
VAEEIDAASFVKSYQAAWRMWRDEAPPTNLDASAFDRTFTAADCYSLVPASIFEITESQLRSEIAGLLEIISS